MRTFAMWLLLPAATVLAQTATPPPTAPAPSNPIAIPRLSTCNGVTTLSNQPAGAASSSADPCATTPNVPPPPPPPQPTTLPNQIGGYTPQPTNANPTIGGVPTTTP